MKQSKCEHYVNDTFAQNRQFVYVYMYQKAEK